ncbi:gliding motility-associated-like protein [Chitinophagaceae bacterium OAS944]|uniref:PKD domain-containing protein n=2 Tax=Niastella sp. OAS944 TaxID=2664089 RepID=UPI0035C80929|nr:gliding motility-associated-like protein [Chitinophagaceae bacterium OAS944]
MKTNIALYKISVALCLLFFFNNIQAQLTANFSATPVAGCAPLLVNFTDASTGNPDQWEWDLGNGTISYYQHPSLTYFNPGIYTIKLTVKKGTASASITKTQYINAYASPVIDFTQSATVGCFPLKVSFTNQSIPGSGNAVSYLWDFGDGTTSTLQHPEHTYSSTGQYNISLRSVNSNGCNASVTRLKAIDIQTGVKAAFTAGSATSCKAPATVPFTNTSTGTGTMSYAWDFGDGSQSTAKDPFHTYTAAGHYIVKLAIKNNSGCTDTFINNNVEVGLNEAKFTSPAISCVSKPVTFSNSSTTNPVSVFWNFGDGATATGASVTHAYAAIGTYPITQVVNFGSCIDTRTGSIQIIKRSVVDFTSPDRLSCKAPYSAAFQANAPDAVDWKWDFGDGTTSTDKAPVHIYNTEGSFKVSLTITNSAGCSETIEKPGYVVVQKPIVRIVDIFQESCVPYNFSPTLDINSPVAIISYLWDFGDGTTSTDPKPTHVYTQKGLYTLSVTYTTKDGCQETISKSNLIKVGNKVTVAFTASPLQVCASDPVNFTDLSKSIPPSTDKIEEWFWQFGDGGTADQQNPTYIYTDTGRFSVSLTVKSNGCASWITYPNYVRIAPPIARFKQIISCGNPFWRGFDNTSLFDRSMAPLSFHWDFGDGTTSNLEYPSHVYAATGKYTVTLTVVNGGCRHTTSTNVFIVDNTLTFTATKDTICPNTDITFNMTISDTTNLISKHITSNYSVRSWFNQSIVTETYTKPGNYTVYAVIIDTNKCQKQIALPVKVIKTTAALAPPAAACINAPAVVTDWSTVDAPLSIFGRTINYGDGTPDEINPVSFRHTWSQAGNYTITLKVTDSKGCTDSTSGKILIADPKASFMSPDSMSCTLKNIAFKSIGDPSYTYTWDFGDGQTTTGANPVHSYNKQGTYSIKLGYTDQYGCRNSFTKLNYVQINDPVATFSISANQSSCPPLVVKFSSTSQYAESVEWDFGDGNTSNLNSPSHFYTYPGEYWPILKVTSKGGCVDIIHDQKITILGPKGTLTYNKTPGCAPLAVNFTGNTTDAVSFVWDFNDGATTTTTPVNPTTAHTYDRPGSYLPRMILKDAQGCQVPVAGKDTLYVYGIQAGFTTDKQSLCDRGFIQFNDASITNDLITGYVWTLGDGTTATTKSFSHEYLAVGDYPVKLEVTTLHNCKHDTALTVPLKVIPSPKAGITGPTSACEPVNFQFAGSLLNLNPYALSWSWDFDNGQTANVKDPPLANYTRAGNYNVALTITNSYNCSGKMVYPIVVHPLPPIDAGNPIVVCRDQPKLLQASGAVNYKWSSTGNLSCTTCSSIMVNPTSTVKYYVEGESAFGCKATDSVLVTVQQPFTVAVNNGDTICIGETYRLQASGTDLYNWTPAIGLDNAQNASPIAKPQTTTLYQVIGKDKNNCFADTAYVPVVVYPYPTITLEKEKTVIVGTSVKLQPTLSADVVSINWSPADWLSCTNCAAPVSTPKQTIQHKLQVANEGGCVTESSVTLLVVCNGENIFIPNTFSPNGDGNNDVFFPRGKGISYIQRFRVYNRWGEEIFKQLAFYTNDASKGWDGTYKGAPVNEDVFVYVVEVVCENGQALTFKGDVTLIR